MTRRYREAFRGNEFAPRVSSFPATVIRAKFEEEKGRGVARARRGETMRAGYSRSSETLSENP